MSNNVNLFEVAARKAYRFPSKSGTLSVEDLWELPLTSAKHASLDRVAQDLYAQIKGSGEVSFVTERTTVDSDLENKLEIAKHIIAVRQAENRAAADALARRQQKQRLLELIAQKENEALSSKSLDELRAELESM